MGPFGWFKDNIMKLLVTNSSFSRYAFLSNYLADPKLHKTKCVKKMPPVGFDLTTSAFPL